MTTVCARTGCQANGNWTPTLKLRYLAGSEPMLMDLPFQVCKAHKSVFLEEFLALNWVPIRAGLIARKIAAPERKLTRVVWTHAG